MQDDESKAKAARFTEAMESGAPDQVAAALSDCRNLVRVPISAPGLEVLDIFPRGASCDVVMDYIWLLSHHRFVPELPPEERRRRKLEAVLRHPHGAAALQIVMYLRHPDEPFGAAIAGVATYVADRGVLPGGEEKGAEYLARYLLDHSQTYSRAVEALAVWRGKPVLDGLLRALTPYVRPEDRAGLGL